MKSSFCHRKFVCEAEHGHGWMRKKPQTRKLR
jgi:hypothetical protein